MDILEYCYFSALEKKPAAEMKISYAMTPMQPQTPALTFCSATVEFYLIGQKCWK